MERDIARIFGLKNVSLHKSDSVADMFVEHDGGSYRLHDMGHGLSHFVQVLTLVALRKPPFIFIDEPEIGLHPTLQMDFLLALASHATKGVFFATHHYALARAVADRVLCVVPEEDGTSRMSPFEETERLSTFLGGLDYAGHRQLGCRGVLLVEGATDVRLVRQALTTLGKARDIAIVPLGGSQMIRRGRSEELAELKRLSESLCVLIDSERSSEADSLSPDRAAFKTDCEQLGIPCHVLCLRASDNYLTGRALAAAFGSEISPLGPFEKHGTKAPCWPKCDGWKAARQMTREEWAQSDLGVFLSSL